ncbi:STAS domain-containing protein [Actinoplanes sp. CA-054009]
MRGGGDVTVVMAATGGDVLMACDACGIRTTVDGCGMHETDVVYVAVTAAGWTGSPFARGRHRCPDCGPAVPTGFIPRPRRAAAGDAGRGLSVATTPSAAVVRVAGDVGADVAPALRRVLDDAVARRSHVVVDLARAGAMAPTGVGTLVRARNDARGRGGDLVLVAPPRVERERPLSGLFRSFDTVPQAIAAASAQLRSMTA